METYYVREFIKETQALFGKKKIFLYSLCFFLSVLEVFASICLMHDINMAKFIIGYNIPIIAAFSVGLIFGRRDWIILGHALTLTGTSASFAVMGFYTLNPDRATLLCCLALYMAACVLRVAGVRRSVRSGRYFAAGKPNPRSLVLLGIPAVAIGQIIARVLSGALSYETNMVIFACLLLFFVFLFSFGSHLYLCFYYMRKYKMR